MAPSLPFTYFIISVSLLMLFNKSISHGGSSPDYSLCSSNYSCGHVKDARFPFCGDNKPSFCGLHEFRLRCNKDVGYPWIYVNQGHYFVHHINSSSHKIIVSRDKSHTCSSLVMQDQESIDVIPPFELGGNVGSLTLFYGCNDSVVSKFDNLSIECPSFGQNASVYYFNKASHGKSCLRSIKLPLRKEVLAELNNGSITLQKALEKEFEIGYTANFSACSNCQKSGGLCGSSFSNASKFECHTLGGGGHQKILSSLALGSTGATMLVLIALIACWYYQRLKSDHSKFGPRSVYLEPTAQELKKSSLGFGVPLFSHKELAEATDNFNELSQLGSGGFGIVFYVDGNRACFFHSRVITNMEISPSGKLRDGREVAVKRLYEKSYKFVEQFMNEVRILTCLRHQNLVSLYGSTSPRCKELLLVYEYVPNGTVADHLHGKMVNSGFLTWNIRMKIAIETATALACLHATDIIHRDIKTNNILLDGNFSVKVADFGLSRLFPVDVTHVSTAPQGSPGYLDPEYYQCYQLTVKSDVYSFGVVLIELISSLPAVDMNRSKNEINLSNYAMKKIQQGLLQELVDPKLVFGSDFRAKEMITRVAELAFQCLQHENEFRPSMDEVLEVLKRIKNADSEALEEKEEPKSDGIGGSDNILFSPTEDDHAGLLICSRSTPSSNSTI